MKRVTIFLVVLACICFFTHDVHLDSGIILNPENGHSYRRFDQTMTWHAAKSFCESLDAHLATITSQQENDFIYDNMVSGSPYDCWLGATDEAVEGIWQWVSGEVWNYTNWSEGEPNNCSDSEHYAAIFPASDSLGRGSLWNDYAEGDDGGCGCGGCAEEWYHMSFLCEWDSSPPAGDMLIFADDFERTELGSNWIVGSGESMTIALVDGRVESTSNVQSIESNQLFSGDLRIEVDLEKIGYQNYGCWDFIIQYGPLDGGVIRFDYDGIDGVAIGPSCPGAYFSIDAAAINRGKAILTYTAPYALFSFVNDDGDIIRAAAADVGYIDSGSIKISLAGMAGSPRYIDNVRVYALDDARPWTRNPANNNFYRLTDAMDWGAAEALALDWGTHLVTIDGASEETWLQAEFGTDESFWIGFNDMVSEGNWVWASGAPVTYTNWCTGEPNDFSVGEDAAILNYSSGCWVDVPDSDSYRGIIEYAASGGSLSGTVTDSGANGLANVRVFAYNNGLGQLWQSAPTDANGDYAINGLPEGCYEIQAFPDAADDYHVSALKHLYLGADEGRTLDFELSSPGYMVSGTVSSGGSGLPGVEVEYDNSRLGIEESVFTDSNGYYEFNNLPPGRGEIGVHAYESGKANTGQDVNLVDDMTELDFALVAESILSGKIVDEYGDGVVNVEVGVWNESHNTEAETFTNADGNFTIYNLPEGIGQFYIGPPGTEYCEPAEAFVYLEQSVTKNIGTIQLERCALAQGTATITNSDDTCELEVEANGSSFSEDDRVVGGAYQIQLPLGDHRIYLEQDGEGPYARVAAPVWVSISAHDIDFGVPVTVPDALEIISAGHTDAATLSGSVLNQGAPAPTGRLMVGIIPSDALNAVTPQSLASIGVIQEMYIDGFGDFELFPVVAGEYDLFYALNNESPDGLNSITILGWQNPIFIPLGGGSVVLPAFNYASAGREQVNGYVLDNLGNPVLGARVLIIDTSAYPNDSDLAGFADTDQNGFWQVFNLPAGTYSFEASHRSYDADPVVSALGDTVTAGSTPQTIDNLVLNIPSSTPGSISGIVTRESDGAPLAGMWVDAYDYDSGEWINNAETQADGSYTIGGLEPTIYRVEVNPSDNTYASEFYNNAPGWNSASQVAVNSGQDTPNINFSLLNAGSISGRITDDNGDGIEGVWVDVSAGRCGYDWVGGEYTDADGNYTIDGLPPIDVYVHAWPDYQNYVEKWYDGSSGTNDCNSAAPIPVVSGSTQPGIDMQLDVGPKRLNWWEVAVWDGVLSADFDLLPSFDKYLESAILTGPNGFEYKFDLGLDYFEWLTECNYMIAFVHDFGRNFDYGEYTLTLNFIDGAQESYSRTLVAADPPEIDPATVSHTVNADGSIDFTWDTPDPNGFYHVRIYGPDGNRYYRSGVVQGLDSQHVSAYDLRCMEKGQTYRYEVRSYDKDGTPNVVKKSPRIDLIYDPVPLDNRILWFDATSHNGNLAVSFDVRPGSRDQVVSALVTGPSGPDIPYTFNLIDDWYDISTESRLNKGWWKELSSTFSFGEYTIEVQFRDGHTENRSFILEDATVTPVSSNMNAQILDDGAIRFTWDLPTGVTNQKYNVRIRSVDNSKEFYRSYDLYDDNEVTASFWDLRVLEHGKTYQWFVRAYDQNGTTMEESNRVDFSYDPFSLAPTGSISGMITASGGGAAEGITVQAFYDRCYLNPFASAVTTTSGDYLISGVYPGQVYVRACADCNHKNYVNAYWNSSGGTADCQSAQAVTVPAGGTASGTDFVLGEGPQRLHFFDVALFNGNLTADFSVHPGYRPQLVSATLQMPNTARTGGTYAFDLTNDFFDRWDTECRYLKFWIKDFAAVLPDDYGEYTLTLNFADGSNETYTKTLDNVSVTPASNINVAVNDDGSAYVTWSRGTSNDYYYVVSVRDDQDKEYARLGAWLNAQSAFFWEGNLRCLEIGQTYRWLVRAMDFDYPATNTVETSEVTATYAPASLVRMTTHAVRSWNGSMVFDFNVRPGCQSHVTGASVTGPQSHTFDLTADWYDVSTETRPGNKGWSKDLDVAPVYGNYTFNVNFDDGSSESHAVSFSEYPVTAVNINSMSHLIHEDGAISFYWGLPILSPGKKYQVRVRSLDGQKEYFASNEYNGTEATASFWDLRALEPGKTYKWFVRSFEPWDYSTMEQSGDQTFVYNPFGQTFDDTDSDGIYDIYDNCPNDPNPDQADTDGDGIGDACEGLGNGSACNDDAECASENCVNAVTAPWYPSSTGACCPVGQYWAVDHCEACTESDGDEVCDSLDNCPSDPNADQADSDGNGIGDVCDTEMDTDGDGIPDLYETNTGVYVSPQNTGTDPNNPDTDGDGYNDGREVEQGSNPLDNTDYIGITDIERAALIALYNSANGDGWTDNSGWKDDPVGADGFALPGTECSWVGIACDASENHLIEISLDGNQLMGSIPPQIGNLSNLQYLYLYNNQLAGSIPTQIGNLSSLLNLRLDANQLTGGIPPEIGDLSNLQYLNLYNNQLTGSIPPQIGNLSNLQYLYLYNNQLAGSIPAEIRNLGNLLHLRLDSNQLTGSIPAEIGDLANLQYLNLYNNQLAGNIPVQIGNLSNLQYLYLYNNQLAGSIPTEISNLSSLQDLRLDHNQLAGSIPPEIGNLSNLQNLYLDHNQLTGSIPAEIGDLKNLLRLYLGGNQLTGSISDTLSNLTQLILNSSEFRYNALYTDDPALRDFLNTVQIGGNWESTQTIAPTNISVGSVADSSVDLSWTAIPYSDDSGGYEVEYATVSGGPYTLFTTTADKNVTAVTVTGLNQGTEYFFHLRTKTDAHGNNQNTVFSEYTPEVSATTIVIPTGYIVSGLTRYSTTLLPDIQVELRTDPDGDTNFDTVEQTVFSDGAGAYQFTNVFDGSYQLRAYGPDPSYITWQGWSLTVAGSNITNQILQLAKNITLLAPSNQTTITTTTPTLEWEGLPEANTYYYLQINRSTGGAWDLVHQVFDIPATAYVLPDPLSNGNLQNGETYTWQVGARDSDGNDIGGTMQAFSFTLILDIDSDGDGLLDAYETNTGTYNGPQDTGTDPNNPDTDGDGFSDLHEVQGNTDPNISADFPSISQLFVEAAGDDNNLGDAAHPLKTLHMAVSRADVSPEISITINLEDTAAYTATSEGADTPVVLHRNMTINGNGARLDGTEAAGWDAGLRLSPGAENITLQNLIIQNFQRGLAIQSGGGCMAMNGVSISTCETGIELCEADQLDLDMGNTVVTACDVGIKISGGSANTTLKNGEVRNSLGDGIRLEASNQVPVDIRLEGIQVADNGGNGILITDGSGHEIFECAITNNNTTRTAYGGVAVIDSCATLRRNEISGNYCYGVFAGDALSTQPLDATYNWWGDASGPTHPSNPGDTGDTVSDYVLFNPWFRAVPSNDTDGDGVVDVEDNCPADPNAGQEDLDDDNIGDVCDPDGDGDGYNSAAFGGADCNDADDTIYPGATEIPGDGIDQDCDGSDLPPALLPGTYYVDPVSGTDDAAHGSAGGAGAWRSLPYALESINAGVSGDYILRLAAGTYTADSPETDRLILINQNLTLFGVGKDLTILDGSGAASWTSGLAIDPGAENVLIQDLTIRHFKTGIIVSSNGGCADLSNVKIELCDTGVKFAESYQVTVDLLNSEIVANKTGIHVTAGSSNNIILNGTVSNNNGDGVFVEASNAVPDDIRFENMTIADNGGNGILIFDGSGHEVIECTITGNNTGEKAYGGVAVYTGCTKINQSIITGNHCYGVWADNALSSEPLDATDNWWGHESGPSGEGSGSGDPVSENVLFEPWTGYDENAAPEPPQFEDVDGDGLPDWWEVQFFGSIGVVNDPNADNDGDGISNRDEYLAGTDPTNAVAIDITQPENSPAFYGPDDTMLSVGGTSQNALTVSLSVNGQSPVGAVLNGDGTWSVANVILSSGPNTIVVTATGEQAIASDSVSVVVDNIDPSIAIEIPTAAGSHVTSLTSISVGGTAADDSGISQVSWIRTASGEPEASGIASGTTSWTTGSIPLADDVVNTIEVTATDIFGNTSAASIDVTREPTVATVEEDLSGEGVQPEPDVDPLDLDGDNTTNADETACGSDPNDEDSTPANLTGASYPIDENHPNFNPNRVKKDTNGTIIGAYLWPDCLNPDDDLDGLPDVWEEQYFDSATAADPNADVDQPVPDGFTNLQEYQNGTDPLVPQIAGFSLAVNPIEPGADFDDWLPGYQNVLQVQASWTGGGTPPAQVWFSLKGTTKLPGRAINDPDPALFATNYPAWYAFNGYDFGLTQTDPTTDDTVHSFEQGPVAVPGVSGTYTIYLQCWDYGGRTRLVAGDAAENPTNFAEIWIPKGSGVNGIGSAWDYDNNDATANFVPVGDLDPNADVDAIKFDSPGVYTNTIGDDIDNLSEYRGIIYIPAGSPVSDHVHERLNPFHKNLFVRAVGFDQAEGDPYRPLDPPTDPFGQPQWDNYYPFRLGLALKNANIDVKNVTGWGHDTTADGLFYVYYNSGSITNVSQNMVTGNAATGWATKWPLLEWEFKLNSDPPSSWTPVSFWQDADTFYLYESYQGGSSGAYTIRLPLPPLNVLIIRLDKVKTGAFSTEDGYIRFLGAIAPGAQNINGARFWGWSTKGLGLKASEVGSYGIANALQIPLDNYFDDTPYQKGTIWENGSWRTPDTAEGSTDLKLSPLRDCEDYQDADAYTDGYADLGLGILLGNIANGQWDGDKRLADPEDWETEGQLNPFDIDSNGYIELPIASDPKADNSSKQYATYDAAEGWKDPYVKAWVLRHTVTHEVCHVLAGPWHSEDPLCVMYKYSNNWKRADHLSDWYRSLLQIHNEMRF